MKKTAEDLKQFKMHQDYVPIKGASLYVFTLEQINELLASQSRPAVLMPGEEEIKQEALPITTEFADPEEFIPQENAPITTI